GRAATEPDTDSRAGPMPLGQAHGHIRLDLVKPAGRRPENGQDHLLTQWHWGRAGVHRDPEPGRRELPPASVGPSDRRPGAGPDRDRRRGSGAMVPADDVRRVALSLPRTEEKLVRDRVKFRVGRIVYVSLSPDETAMGFGYPKEERAALIAAEP